MLVKRSVSLSGHRTSIALEPEFWSVIDQMAAAYGLSPAALVAAIDATRTPTQPLASSLRVAVLAHLKKDSDFPGRINQ